MLELLLASGDLVSPLARMFGAWADAGPMIAMGIPLAGAALIWALGMKGLDNARELVTIITSLILLHAVTSMVPLALAFGTQAGAGTIIAAEVVPGLPLAFHIEPLGMLYALIASSLWILNSFYSFGYMRAHNEEHQTRFYVCFALAISSVMGIAFSANAFTLFICYEALTLTTFPLVSHAGTAHARRSARTYLGVLVSTSVGFLLVAIVSTYMITGRVDFAEGGVFREALASDQVRPELVATLFAMYIFGIGKAALMPMHRWLPAAMVAPTPVSALLHAVAVVKAGVFTVLKVTVYIFGINTMRECAEAVIGGDWLVYMASFTILAASGIAMYQDNLKRRLAYSTISQLSYITLGAALLTESSIQGGALHMVMHAFGKITLFFVAGAIYVAHHKTEISDMRGIGRKMPLTMTAFLLATISIIGLPPMGGAWSKWLLVMGSLEADQQFVILVLVISSLLNIAYLLPIAVNAFFLPDEAKSEAPPPDDGHHDGDGVHDHHQDKGSNGFWLESFGFQEAPAFMVIPLCLTALACVLLFIYPDPFLELARAIRLG